MSEFSKLNGYDVKDATARADISSLKTTTNAVAQKVKSIEDFCRNDVTSLMTTFGGFSGEVATSINTNFQYVPSTDLLACGIVTPNQYQFTPQGNAVTWHWCVATDNNNYLCAYVDGVLVVAIKGFTQLGPTSEGLGFVGANPK